MAVVYSTKPETRSNQPVIVQLGGLIFGDDQRVAKFVADGLGHGFPTGTYHAIGHEGVDGNLTIGAIFHNFRTYPTGKECEISVYSRHAALALRDAMERIMRYPFRQLDCTRVTAETLVMNRRCTRLLEGFGFRLEGVKRGTNAAVYGLLREEFL